MSRVVHRHVAVARRHCTERLTNAAAPAFKSPHRVTRRVAGGRSSAGPGADAASTEQLLLAFDAEEDLAGLVPMPTTIPPRTRQALTSAFAAQFEHHDALDQWLHGPLEALGRNTPFERIVEGDGDAVLEALRASVAPDSLER